MKNTLFSALLGVGALLSSCQNSELVKKGSKTAYLPLPGTIIDSSFEPVMEDKLNHFTCSVKIIADSTIASGVYNIVAEYGPNFAEGQLTMPKGAENFRLFIKKGSMPCSFIIGFKMPDDTVFYDYFEVACGKSATKMQYIKAYTF